ncbi:MAG: hypothetical protein ACXAC5_00375 [Promethearchaeota archaeon]|jgi:hypothetical protein
MRTKLYKDYIKSPEWENRKTQFKSRHPKRCFVCNSSRQVELHHLSYIRLGNETDEDLCWLCLPHHVEVHNLIRKSSTIHAQAHWVIKKRFNKKRFNKIRQNRKKLQRPHQLYVKRIFDICVEIFDFHGIECDWSDYGQFDDPYGQFDDPVVCKSVRYMYNILLQGDNSWHWKGDLFYSSFICLDPSKIHKSKYWCMLQKLEQNKQKESRRLASFLRRRVAAMKRIQIKKDLYNQHIREARIKNRRLVIQTL